MRCERLAALAIISFFLYRFLHRQALHRRVVPLPEPEDFLDTPAPLQPMDTPAPTPPQPAPDTWNVDFVVLVHVSGDPDRLKAITSTWCRRTSKDMEFVLIGGEHGDMFTSQKLPGDTAFHQTKRAFVSALRIFPYCRYIAKFDDDSYVYTRELVRQAVARGADYLGYPIHRDGIMYGQGGAGYVLSRAAAQSLMECDPPIPDEDMAVGACLERAGISLEFLHGLHPHSPYQMLRWDKTGHPWDRPIQRAPLDGYMNPISYHYITPRDMVAMHDDIHLHGTELRRSRSIPRILHQFWEGEHGKPKFLLQKCREIHHDWEHIVWTRDLIRARFPSAEDDTHPLPVDGRNGALVNQDHYDRATAKNLLSDIARYEVLMMYGGVYMDADSECFRPIDHLLFDAPVAQAFGFLEKDRSYHGALVGSSVIGSHPFSPLTVALISLLQDTNWNEAPWVSAGPMHLTKTIRRFDAPAQAYWGVHIFDSYLVFPFHHSSKRPQNLVRALVEKGAVTDQQWGTTFQAYKDSDWEDAVRTSTHVAWLRPYLDRVYAAGLSTLPVHRPRWVVPVVNGTLCEQVSGVVSAAALAMATGRVLLWDWDSLADTFEQGALTYSLPRALQHFGYDLAHFATLRLSSDSPDFLHSLRWSDVDRLYKQPLLFVHGGGWWAGGLLDNRLYSSHVFGRRNATAVFADLYSALFPPRQEPPLCEINASQHGQGPGETTHIFCFPMHKPSDSAVQSLQRTLRGMDLPAAVLVDDAEQWGYLQSITKARLFISEAPNCSADELLRYDQITVGSVV